MADVWAVYNRYTEQVVIVFRRSQDAEAWARDQGASQYRLLRWEVHEPTTCAWDGAPLMSVGSSRVCEQCLRDTSTQRWIEGA